MTVTVIGVSRALPGFDKGTGKPSSTAPSKGQTEPTGQCRSAVERCGGRRGSCVFPDPGKASVSVCAVPLLFRFSVAVEAPLDAEEHDVGRVQSVIAAAVAAQGFRCAPDVPESRTNFVVVRMRGVVLAELHPLTDLAPDARV